MTPAFRKEKAGVMFLIFYSFRISKIRRLQLDVFEEITQIGSNVFALWNFNLFFCFFLCFLKNFHAQADFPVFDSDYFYLNSIATFSTSPGDLMCFLEIWEMCTNPERL